MTEQKEAAPEVQVPEQPKVRKYCPDINKVEPCVNEILGLIEKYGLSIDEVTDCLRVVEDVARMSPIKKVIGPVELLLEGSREVSWEIKQEASTRPSLLDQLRNSPER
ncbi:hypothetical protein [Heliophilum fasciatum]|uniref:Uncharacterized protein n=1 Tax=Heliophilum fasciatum TaxID=35700 RepID=A0A4R2RXM7_9FIRM|nr:hypothetical protein [Heliophilum fasciatum]MCW2277766.1 hypothetical protein [Heliophilum fasciatum]TCP64741.1 hypothetical protein EDD73_10894 [Heliophilum fasciatum]